MGDGDRCCRVCMVNVYLFIGFDEYFGFIVMVDLVDGVRVFISGIRFVIG